MSSYEVYKVDNTDTPNNKIIDYVIYSHSSFLEVLQIQIDYIKGKGRMTLFIDENASNLDHIYEQFDKVVFYQDGPTYPNKLLTCLKQIDYDYFIFIHDNDILFDVDNEKICYFFDFLRKNNYDRIDFQLAYDFNSERRYTIMDNGLYLIKSSNTDTANKGYIYNVNPSIWKRETLMTIMEKYHYYDYRTIEHPEVQVFCLRFNIFKLFSTDQFNCGYFICLQPFKYLHITHSQKYLHLGSIPEDSYKDIKDVYEEIINKYNLRNSGKWIH